MYVHVYINMHMYIYINLYVYIYTRMCTYISAYVYANKMLTAHKPHQSGAVNEGASSILYLLYIKHAYKYAYT